MGWFREISGVPCLDTALHFEQLAGFMSGPDGQKATSHIQMQSVFYSIRAVDESAKRNRST